MKVEFKGGQDIERALAALPQASAKAAARRVMRRALAVFIDRVSQLAPRKIGSLGVSYGIGTRLTKRQAGLARREGRDDVFLYAGTADPAGQQQEFGNARHAPQPHARPAWDETQQAVFDLIQDGMAAEVEKTVQRYAKRMARKNQ